MIVIHPDNIDDNDVWSEFCTREVVKVNLVPIGEAADEPTDFPLCFGTTETLPGSTGNPEGVYPAELVVPFEAT